MPSSTTSSSTISRNNSRRHKGYAHQVSTKVLLKTLKARREASVPTRCPRANVQCQNAAKTVQKCFLFSQGATKVGHGPQNPTDMPRGCPRTPPLVCLAMCGPCTGTELEVHIIDTKNTFSPPYLNFFLRKPPKIFWVMPRRCHLKYLSPLQY